MQRAFSPILVLVAVVAAAALAIAWWLSGAETAPPPPTGEGANSAVVDVPREAPMVEPPSALPPGTPRVRVQVTPRERFVPPPAARVAAERAGDGAVLASYVLAGTGAGFDAPPAADGLALASIAYESGAVLRQVPVGREVARVVVGARLAVRGTVRDAAQKPVAGARVWLGELDAEGAPREGVTDYEGKFELDAPAGDGVPFVVRGDGFASQWRAVTVNAPLDLEATLQPGCSLEVQLAATATDVETARCFVVPHGSVASELAHFPFLLQATTDGAAVDAAGRGRIDGLPQGVQVGVVVRHPKAPRAAPFAVALKGKFVRAVVPVQFSAAVWTGRVVGKDGAPLAGVEVWSRPAQRELAAAGSARLLPPHLTTLGVCATRTAGDGTFVVGAAAADAVLSLRAYGHAGRDLARPADAAPHDFVLPAWTGGDVAFRLAPPLPGIAWVAECDLAGGVRAQLAAGETWLVAFPSAGTFDVVVTTFVDDRVRGEARHPGLHVTGLVELASPRPE